MIVSTTVGDIWRVKPNGTATELAAAIGPAAYWEGLTTIPNNPTESGPLAGKILAADENTNALITIDASGHVTTYPIGFGNIETVKRPRARLGIQTGSLPGHWGGFFNV